MEIIKIYSELKKLTGDNARILIEEVFQEKFEDLIKYKSLNQKKLKEILKIKEKIERGENIFFILKKAFFHGEEFHIEKGVLIPREETYEIVNYLKKLKRENLKPERILDFGSGSGILAIWAKRIFPFSDVYAVDFSKKAIKVTKINSIKKKVSLKIIRAKSFDIFKDEAFDIIITNPPYLSQEEFKKYGPFKGEPKSALIGGKRGYEKFLKWLKEGLKKIKEGGFFISEISPFWDKEILKEFEKFLIDEINDFAGRKRVWVIRKICS